MIPLLLFTLTLGQVVMSNNQFTDLAQGEWELYKMMYNKVYKTDVEEQFRMNVFFDNKLKVIQHNIKHAQNLTSYQMGLNHFSDMLANELVSTTRGRRSDYRLKALAAGYKAGTFIPPGEGVIAPESLDWRTKGVVTPVKDQGHCGSCWTFSATGALEGQYARRHHKLVSLSEQNILDCCLIGDGCDGGDEAMAFECIAYDGGIESEADYPYEGRQNECRFNRSQFVAHEKGAAWVRPRRDEEVLKSAVAVIGPISIGIYAHPHMSAYHSGIFYEEVCPEKKIDHAVLVVGYGTEDGQDYWLIKNSWSERWGEKGYMKLARNRGNACGVASEGSYPRII